MSVYLRDQVKDFLVSSPNDLLHRILRINATCIERPRHGRRGAGRKNKRVQCSVAGSANGLQHYAAWDGDNMRPVKQALCPWC